MKNTNKIYAMIIAIIMLMSSFMLMFNNISFAMDQEVEPQVQGEEGQEEESFTVNFGTASWEVNNVTVTATSQWIRDLSGGPIEIGERDLIRLNNFNNNTMQIIVEGENQFRTKLSLVSADETTLLSRDAENLPKDSTLTFRVEPKPQEDVNEGENDNPPPAVIVGGPDDIEFDVKFDDTHMLMQVNNMNIMDDADGDLKDSFKGIVEGAGVTSADGTNVFRFQNVFGDKPVREYVVNGVTYKEGDEEVAVDEEGAYILTLPGAAKYTITGVGDPDFIVPRTVIWVNPDYVPRDEADAEWVKDFTVEHGYARVIEVYDENDNLLEPDEYVNERGDEYGLDDGFGWVQIFPGYRVVFEFVPEYGYQLTGIAINENPLEAIDDVVNRFEIILPNDPEGSGNLHFAATFTKTEDVVKTNSKNVSSGEITLEEGLENGGTARLNVNDAEISEEKRKEFEDVAGEYTITDFLGIDLYQIFYKGKEDSEDVWENKIEDLDKEATITIKLDQGFEADDIKILHNIHDGEEFEVIKIESFDKETNEVTFKTSSFSNYAIATKKVETVEITIKDLDSKVIITFEESDGHSSTDFELVAIDISSLTDEQIAQLGITKEEYEKGLETIKENSKTHGELILLYNIEVSIPGEDRNVSEGPFTIRIPYTDELKEYESFKLAYVDSEDYSLKDLIELKLEDGYLVGTLEHLSPYALIGKVAEVIEPTPTPTPTPAPATPTPTPTPEETSKYSNPSTGDNIIIFTSIFVLSILAMAFELVVVKKSK